MIWVFHKLPRNIKHILGRHTKRFSENEMRSMTIYAKSHIEQHGFENNIHVPWDWKEKDLSFVQDELCSGDKDSVKLNFYDEE